MVPFEVLWKVHSKNHAVAVLTSQRHAGKRSHEPRYTTIGALRISGGDDLVESSADEEHA